MRRSARNVIKSIPITSIVDDTNVKKRLARVIPVIKTP